MGLRKPTPDPHENEAILPLLRRQCNARYLLVEIVVPIVENRVFRWIIIIFFAVLASLGIYSVESLSTISDVDALVPDDSYLLDFVDALRALTTEEVIPGNLEVIGKNIDFSDFGERNRAYEMIQGIESLPLSSPFRPCVVGKGRGVAQTLG